MKRGSDIRNFFSVLMPSFLRKRTEATPAFNAPALDTNHGGRRAHRFSGAGTTSQSRRRQRYARKHLRQISIASRRANR